MVMCDVTVMFSKSALLVKRLNLAPPSSPSPPLRLVGCAEVRKESAFELFQCVKMCVPHLNNITPSPSLFCNS